MFLVQGYLNDSLAVEVLNHEVNDFMRLTGSIQEHDIVQLERRVEVRLKEVQKKDEAGNTIGPMSRAMQKKDVST